MTRALRASAIAVARSLKRVTLWVVKLASSASRSVKSVRMGSLLVFASPVMTVSLAMRASPVAKVTLSVTDAQTSLSASTSLRLRLRASPSSVRERHASQATPTLPSARAAWSVSQMVPVVYVDVHVATIAAVKRVTLASITATL